MINLHDYQDNPYFDTNILILFWLFDLNLHITFSAQPFFHILCFSCSILNLKMTRLVSHFQATAQGRARLIMPFRFCTTASKQSCALAIKIEGLSTTAPM